MIDGGSGMQCPVADRGDGERITLAHGEGGRLTRRLIHEHILPILGNNLLNDLADAAALPEPNGRLAVTTDSYVVTPLFFPGGDIGSLAVYGTVNDLAVAGARPMWISVAFILEEGLPFDNFDRVLGSIAKAADRCGISVVTGDTKVVPRGAADGLFINTTGIGELLQPVPSGPCALEVGDALIISGPVGRHGMAVMTSREGLEFDSPPTSDSAPLHKAVDALRNAAIPISAMRDATRGGLTAVLHEWAGACRLTLAVEETSVPVTPQVRGACELLGLDPFHVACEGTMVVSVPADAADEAIRVLQRVPESEAAARIGIVRKRAAAAVVVRRALGHDQPLDEPLGAPLPRIC